MGSYFIGEKPILILEIAERVYLHLFSANHLITLLTTYKGLIEDPHQSKRVETT
jgi:hypothetical protein